LPCQTVYKGKYLLKDVFNLILLVFVYIPNKGKLMGISNQQVIYLSEGISYTASDQNDMHC